MIKCNLTLSFKRSTVFGLYTKKETFRKCLFCIIIILTFTFACVLILNKNVYMKKFYFSSILILLISSVVRCQESCDKHDPFIKSAVLSKGNKIIEGGLSLSTGNSNNDYFGFSPKFGYLVSEKVVLGGDIDITSTDYLLSTNGPDRSNSFGIGGYARLYFLQLRNFKAFGEAGIGYNHTRLDYAGGKRVMNNGIKANVDLGINYFFTSRWAATFTLAQVFTYNNSNPENGSNTNDLVVNINLFNNIFAQPKFGLLYKW